MGFENWEGIARHAAIGALWETHVVMQVVKHFFSLGRTVPLWFWRTSQGEEVDLLIERGGQFIAIECKYAEYVDQTSLKGIKALMKVHGPENLIAGYIATKKPDPFPLSSQISSVSGSFIDSVL
jgi:predicted AAA+ superfamily ATPase